MRNRSPWRIRPIISAATQKQNLRQRYRFADVRNERTVLVKDGKCMSETDKNSQIDDAVWLAWLNKNKAQDRFRYERRLRVMALAAVFVTVSALLWRFVG